MNRHAICALVVAVVLGVSGCQVQWTEQHDPQISRGLSDYQQALERFLLRTADAYERCSVARQWHTIPHTAACAGDPPSTRVACQTRLNAEASVVKALADAMCTSASYQNNANEFYFPNEALLRVLAVRARVLDSGGACVQAVNGVTKLTAFVTDQRIRQWIGSSAAANTRNCTEVQVQTVLSNHRELQVSHQRLDELASTGTLKAIDYRTVFGPDSLVLDTSEQNIKIALFLEEAKKRGAK